MGSAVLGEAITGIHDWSMSTVNQTRGVQLRVCRSRCALRRILEEAAHGEEEKSREKADSKEGAEEIGARATIAPQVPSSLEEGPARTEVDSGRSFAVGTRGRRCTAHAPGGPEGCVTVCSTEAPTLI